MKKLYMVLLILVCIAVGITGYRIYKYSNTYSSPNDDATFEEIIKMRINNPTSSSDIKYQTNKIEIIVMREIDNNKYVMFSMDEGFGSAELICGENGKYKLGHIEYYPESDGPNSFWLTDTNKSRYFIIFASNYESKIKSAKAKFQNYEYTVAIPQEEYYIIYFPVPKDTTVQGLVFKFLEY